MTDAPLPLHSPSLLGRALRLFPGVRRVAAQVEPYAEQWHRSNAAAAGGEGPLWVVMGDSTAQGVGAPSYDGGWVGQLRQALDAERNGEAPWRVLNWSMSGARAADVLHAQLGRLAAEGVDPDLLTVAVGANDVYRTPLPAVVHQMREIMGRLPAGAVIATVPQGLRPRKAQAINAVIRTEAPGVGLVVADVWATTGPPWRGKFASDSFHPGPLGYADWAAAFASALGLGR